MHGNDPTDPAARGEDASEQPAFNIPIGPETGLSIVPPNVLDRSNRAREHRRAEREGTPWFLRFSASLTESSSIYTRGLNGEPMPAATA
jgi:hypothetical protein